MNATHLHLHLELIQGIQSQVCEDSSLPHQVGSTPFQGSSMASRFDSMPFRIRVLELNIIAAGDHLNICFIEIPNFCKLGNGQSSEKDFDNKEHK